MGGGGHPTLWNEVELRLEAYPSPRGVRQTKGEGFSIQELEMLLRACNLQGVPVPPRLAEATGPKVCREGVTAQRQVPGPSASSTQTDECDSP